MKTPHPLIARLTEADGLPLLDQANLPAFLSGAGDAVLFCAGDPAQYPESLDVAVVLPELLRAFPGRLRAGVAAPGLEPDMQARYGFNRWPALIFLRDGAYVGALAGIQDWSVYLARVGELLVAPVRRPPSVGIAVATAAPATCH